MPRRYHRADSQPRTTHPHGFCVNPSPALQRRPRPASSNDLRNAVAAALDTVGIAWTVDATDDSAHVLAAGCYIALIKPTGLPALWAIDTDSGIDAVAAALTGVQVRPHPDPPTR